MNRLRRRVLAAITTAPLWSRAAAQGKPPARAPRALGYLPWWMSAGWQAMPLAQLDRIVLFDSPIGRDGRLGGHSWIERAVPFLNHAKRSRLPVEVALTLPDHEGFTNTFGDAARRSRLLADC